MKQAFRALAFLAALLPSWALAQSAPATMPYHTVYGRLGAAPGNTGPGQAIPFTNFLPALVGVQSPNTVYAGPLSGAANTPSFRALTNTDLPLAPAFTVKCNPTGTSARDQDCTQAQATSFIGSFITPQNYNASGSGQNTTGTITSGSPTLTLAAALDFKNAQGIRVNHAGAAFAIVQPTALIVTPTGTPGGTTYTYTIASLDANGGVGQSIANVATSTGNAALTNTNYNLLSWTPAASAAAYAVYGNISGSLTLIGITNGTTFNDIGSGGTQAPDWIPAAPQTSASLADWLITTISSGAGTTTLTLAANATTAATTQFTIHDDTVAVALAVTAAQNSTLYAPSGTYWITSQINIAGRTRILGSGYPGDSGGGYAGSGVTSCPSNATGTMFCSGALNNVFSAVTNQAVVFEDLQISYPVQPASGYTAINIQAVAGAGNSNTQSRIRNVMMTGAYYAVQLTNCLDFLVADNQFLYGWGGALIINSPNYPSYNQAKITNNLFWGNGGVNRNNVYNFHMQLQAGGDLIITGNKTSSASQASSAISILGASSGTQNFEPLVIVGNSIEGTTNCITFSTANASYNISQISITGNQMWCGTSTVRVNTFGVSQWVLAMSITGNSLTVNGGASKTNIVLDNVNSATVTGNAFACSGGCTTSTGVLLNSKTTGVSVNSNVYDPGYTTKISNLAASGLNTQTDIPCPAIAKVFTSGTNSTFTLDTCAGNLPQYLEMELAGAGGGGAGSGTTPGAATAGGATCFNTSSPACTTPVYQAGGGPAGTTAAGAPIAGGTISGSGTCDDALAGAGAAPANNQVNSYGGAGGASPYGGAGAPAFSGPSAGGAAAANSGSGGGGAGAAGTVNSGGGGAAGAWCRVKIGSLAASYFYTIGPAGTGGTLGTSGAAGGNGGAGRFKAIERWF